MPVAPAVLGSAARVLWGAATGATAGAGAGTPHTRVAALVAVPGCTRWAARQRGIGGSRGLLWWAFAFAPWAFAQTDKHGR